MRKQAAPDSAAATVTLRVFRFHPEAAASPRYQDYRVPAAPGMTVLEALVCIKEHLDATLAYRSSCRMGICGSCGMFVNGFPRLACQTQVQTLGSLVQVGPLPNYPVIRDVVPDLEPMVTHHAAVRPFIIRDEREQEPPTTEYLQTPGELEAYLQFAYCIKCGLCLAACPTVATDPAFTGPQALAQAYRYSADSRDWGFTARRAAVDHPHGLWRCHLAGACTEACPKGVDPALAIQLLKRLALAAALGMGRRRPAPLAPPPVAVQRRPDIPAPPPPIVGASPAADPT
ncbi:MAG: succinate dehydrogenase iron-sulfur subunit [Armatimonadota bacterium]|nr:succinate dehydrogenase iron-sulfur subunit [Armatimonadota bacterium]MDR7426581.1 succinate dehydrogenase iron-sulfur subunit [Armatimonadota bacterium]MDR7463680.1 succinate dehydrogenase iron-sulfur subunit [Armatimonadota bacterium]MDR7468601.1 succinate dehydrogenase iron-sulfur subunit [Armatimonadota bacterium]MDR7473724.1 succinate dehydrogenase iron-sulfur subunit [Armatimonadota bacterium]